ncbi:hypothetical protein RRG08_017680 [Elysia crispata]|uniref:Uncharacterized protein n=1 Tax=Elysia crispata TaxID=231223 RepID=A0AAE0ZBC5_9GAST|nr:hypothetical protein RRG08_017680 [Elysia crispata]
MFTMIRQEWQEKEIVIFEEAGQSKSFLFIPPSTPNSHLLLIEGLWTPRFGNFLVISLNMINQDQNKLWRLSLNRSVRQETFCLDLVFGLFILGNEVAMTIHASKSDVWRHT